MAGPAALVLCATPAGAVSCTVSVAPLAFGAYNAVTKAQVTSSTTLTLSCTGPGSLTYTLSFSPGQSGSETARYMASGGVHLAYQIYKDTGYTEVLGDGASSTYTYGGSANLPSGTSTGTAPVYGRVTAGQGVAPGTYSDAITLLVTY